MMRKRKLKNRKNEMSSGQGILPGADADVESREEALIFCETFSENLRAVH
jgi:hypothetical protein